MPDIFADGTDTLILDDSLNTEYINNLGDSFTLEETLIVEAIAEYPIYGSMDESNRYFAVLLHGELWERESRDRKYKALVSATSLIDELRFGGVKTDDTQTLEFPRYGDTEVPIAIRQATFEVALALLRGIDIEAEYENLFVSSRKFGPVETKLTGSVPEHKKHRIPTVRAWQKLLPYLKPALDLKIRRVD